MMRGVSNLIGPFPVRAPLMFCQEPENPENHLKVRMINMFTEDPATGSANGCLAGYLARYRCFGDSKIDARVEQGKEIGRPSLLYLKSEDRGEEIDVYIGGKNAMVAKGAFIYFFNEKKIRESIKSAGQICPYCHEQIW